MVDGMILRQVRMRGDKTGQERGAMVWQCSQIPTLPGASGKHTVVACFMQLDSYSCQVFAVAIGCHQVFFNGFFLEGLHV